MIASASDIIEQLRAEWEAADRKVADAAMVCRSPRKRHLNHAYLAALEASAAAEKALVDAMDARAAGRRVRPSAPSFL